MNNCKIKPEFTAEQQAECKSSKCRHLSGKQAWCGKFNCFIDGREEKKRRIITPSKKIVKPALKGMPAYLAGCCGKAKNIALGWRRYLAGTDYPWSRNRLTTCLQCPEVTWLTTADYYIWLARHGLRVIKDPAHLDKLPPLPKEPQQPGTEPYCRICKCFVKAKVLVEQERCPAGKWGLVDKLITV